MTSSRVRAVLLASSLVPVLAGAVRLREIGTGVVTAENARFLAVPFPVQAHILCASAFALLGALQLTPKGKASMRAHRFMGMIAVLSGVVVALTGLWMTVYYPAVGFDGAWLFRIRLAVGVAMMVSLAIAVAAIAKRKFGLHRDWMIRAYALGMGAATQVFTHLPWLLIPSIQGEISRTAFMAAGWVINLAIAERVIRRTAAPLERWKFRRSARLPGSHFLSCRSSRQPTDRPPRERPDRSRLANGRDHENG